MERFNLLIQTIHCDTFKQARAADRATHKVFNAAFLNVLECLFDKIADVVLHWFSFNLDT